MLIVQTLSILVTLATYSFFILWTFRKFNVSMKLSVYFILPLSFFCIGFLMRLSLNQGLIDLGFFFTESSVMFLTVLFSIALFLGQLKYYKK